MINHQRTHFIVQGFRTIVFILIVLFTTFRPICPPPFFRCLSNLQHRAKAISSDTDAYQEDMSSLRHNLHRNNNQEWITSAPRNLDRRIEDDTRKLTIVCLPYVKGLAERMRRIYSPYDIRTIFTNDSTFWRHLPCAKPPTEFNMTKNCVYSIPCSCSKVHKGKTYHPLEIRLEEHRKAVVWGEIEKAGKKRETVCPYGIKLK